MQAIQPQPLTEQSRPQPAAPPPTETGRRSPDAAFRLVVLAALYAIPLVTALQPVAEFDTWWHLRTGQWIVEHGTVPTTDPFTSFGADKPWVAYSWLFGLLLYGLYQVLGLAGVVLYRVVLALAVVAAVHRLIARRERRFAITAALVAAAAIALTPLLLGERPGLFTILFATLTVDAILSLHEGSRRWTVWLLPLCYVLWANIHVQFVHGLFLLGVACAAPVADRVLRREPGPNADTWGSRGWWQLVGLTAACFLATLLNPYHVQIYSLVLAYGGQTATYHLFPELKALDFRQISDWAVLALAGAAVFALGRRGRVSAFDVLFLAAAGYFSFHAKHDLWFVVLAAIAVLAGPRRAAEPEAKPAGTWWQPALVAAALVGVALVVGWKRDLSEEHLQERVAAEFPVAAAAVVEERGYAGPLYHHYDWGGYLIWRLPQLPAAIDGRTNLHGDQRIKQFADTWQGLPGWDRDPDLAAAGVVILQRRAPLASLLRRDGRFELVHEDDVAVVFVRGAR